MRRMSLTVYERLYLLIWEKQLVYIFLSWFLFTFFVYSSHPSNSGIVLITFPKIAAPSRLKLLLADSLQSFPFFVQDLKKVWFWLDISNSD